MTSYIQNAVDAQVPPLLPCSIVLFFDRLILPKSLHHARGSDGLYVLGGILWGDWKELDVCSVDGLGSNMDNNLVCDLNNLDFVKTCVENGSRSEAPFRPMFLFPYSTTLRRAGNDNRYMSILLMNMRQINKETVKCPIKAGHNTWDFFW